MGRADAVERSLAALRFFHDSDQSESPQATGFKGFYYHFLDRETGARVWRSELSMIDSALLIADALTAGRYFNANTADEIELRELVNALYRRVDWRWAQHGAVDRRDVLPPETEILIGEPDAIGYDALQDEFGYLIHGVDNWPTLRLPKPSTVTGARKRRLTLLYAAKDPEHKNAVVLQSFLADK